MNTMFSGLALVGALAVSTTQADAITFSTSAPAGTATVIEVVPEEFYSWQMSTSETAGINAVTFTNDLAVGIIAEVRYTWSLLSGDNSTPTSAVLEFFNAGSTILLASSTAGATGGPITLRVQPGDQFGFNLISSGSVPLASANGQLSIAAIPLPAGALLLLTALGGLAATRRLKKTTLAAKDY